eukprot:11166525-Lingulodinium_polyedra.AAC.1
MAQAGLGPVVVGQAPSIESNFGLSPPARLPGVADKPPHGKLTCLATTAWRPRQQSLTHPA